MEIKGRHLIEGVPKTITISDEEIRESLAETVNVIVDAVRVALERTPPELSADIVDRGIVLTGGGSLLKNLDKRLREETGPAGGDGRGPAVDGRARRRQDAVELRAAAEDLAGLRHGDDRSRGLGRSCRVRSPMTSGLTMRRRTLRPARRHLPRARPADFRAGAVAKRAARARVGGVRRLRAACRRITAGVADGDRAASGRTTSRCAAPRARTKRCGSASSSSKASCRRERAGSRTRALEEALDLQQSLVGADAGRARHRRQSVARRR